MNLSHGLGLIFEVNSTKLRVRNSMKRYETAGTNRAFSPYGMNASKRNSTTKSSTLEYGQRSITTSMLTAVLHLRTMHSVTVSVTSAELSDL